jgi:hypothetical protein
MRKLAHKLSGFLVVVALFLLCPVVVPFIAHVLIYLGRDNYKAQTFVVTGAHYTDRGKNRGNFWLIGTVCGRQEVLPLPWHQARVIHSEDDVLACYPKGSPIAVLYNPTATTQILQGISLRVQQARPTFWQDEAAERWSLGLMTLVPLPLSLAIYLPIRFANRRRHHRPNRLRG